MTERIESSARLVKAEIFRQQLYNIAEEMGTVMIRTSGDPVISEAVDFSTFIADKNGEIISFSGYMTMHAGPARQAVRYILQTLSEEEIQPGDAFICNDPHTTGACHPPDVGIVKPIFYQNQLVAWCWAEGHLLDVGGMSPGGFAIGAHDAYSEALRFPGVKIVSQGKLLKNIVQLIQANFRLPNRNLNDIRCFIAACNVSENRIIDLIDKYGLDEFSEYVEFNKVLTENAFRKRISQLPKKTYEGTEWVEHNGHVNQFFPIHCKLTIHAEHLTFDFTGTAPQTDGFVNVSEGAAIGCAVTPVMLVLTPDIPFNEGIFRAIEFILPEGTLVNCKMPAPVSSGHMETGMRMTKLLTELLSQAMMESEEEMVRSHAMACFHDAWIAGTFAGSDSEGNPTVFLDMNGGGAGGGAQTNQDGLDAAASFTQLSNGLPDIEINELAFPVLYLWRKLNINSGGPGKYRGGQGIEFAWIPWDIPGGQEHVNSACWQVPARGTMGGYPGGTSGYWVVKHSNVHRLMEKGKVPMFSELEGEKALLPAKHSGFPILRDDVFVQFEGGGGGLGDPLKRNPKTVLQDHQDGYITQEMAKNAYGVIIDGKGQLVEEDTQLFRAAMKKERLGMSRPPKAECKGDTKELIYVKSSGESLHIKKDENELRYVCCADCGHPLAEEMLDWKDGVRMKQTEASEALGKFGMWVKRRDSAPFVYVDEYICPGCASMIHVGTSIGENNK
ncbi:hydantoinase B/oxoprolinase family protein [Aneurinibacillus sp. Ricciae_BoGa-3]|uniref:hydantoinase B/oxoprolinase family protein n=1 Tax=Aneurinibacillus sp. Ricciae_BoGa-3 TaxID=3022697 RepID=UPI00233FB33F|nr:hydantoinase B/oxoprolinase family protein [Aneurinibacillus sp. Ricciae_BoGa-3]WCK56247.1 hydantoinase B/oxoprolinase family protein [Aneurinibacillus sp. Ricciae_BoGa-3]